MPWQLVSSQMGLSSSGLQERRRSQAERTEGPSLGLETPRGSGNSSQPGSGAHWVLLGAGDEAPSGCLIGPPQAGATGYLGAQAPGALSQPPDSSSPDRGLPA